MNLLSSPKKEEIVVEQGEKRRELIDLELRMRKKCKGDGYVELLRVQLSRNNSSCGRNHMKLMRTKLL